MLCENFLLFLGYLSFSSEMKHVEFITKRIVMNAGKVLLKILLLYLMLLASSLYKRESVASSLKSSIMLLPIYLGKCDAN